METNYKVKNRCILLPFRLMLLLVALVFLGYTSYAQQADAARVSNIQQLEQALDNPLVSYIILDETFEGPTNRDYISAELRARSSNGNRNFTCAYVINDNDTCFFDPADDNGFVHNTAAAYAIDISLTGGCPGDDDGLWSQTLPPLTDIPPPPGSTLIFIGSPTSDTIEFKVDHPGVYTIRYTWLAPWNSHVQTEYKFFSPFVIEELFAPDVCGLETTVDLEISAYFGDPDANIYYTLWNPCTGQTVPFAGPELDTLWYYNNAGAPPHFIDNDTTQVENFLITVPDYGNWKFIVTIADGECGMMSDTIDIEFSVEPIADAGDDVFVCDDMCVTLIGSAGWMFYSECYQASNYAYSWVQLSGPVPLTITPASAETTYVCGTTDCWYGEYEIEFQVINGECYDSDTMLLTFYEQPVADAGSDQFICEDLCFSLNAIPYQYCSPELGDERFFYWELVSTPANCGENLLTWNADINNPTICVDETVDCCPYGEYVFKWVEINGTCSDSAYVSIFLFEQPVADAGADSVTECFYGGCFTVTGIPYSYCSDTLEGFNRTHTWTVTAMPAGVTVNVSEVVPYEFVICPIGDCVYGEYEVVLTESNDQYCVGTGSDTIHFFLFEPPDADAGEDFTMCYTGGCFSMGAVAFDYCSDPAPEWGERYGEWTKVAGPAMVEFFDATDPDADACPDESDDCVYGVYTFQWTEYNGDCVDEDTVVVTLYESPTADAGDDAYYCLDAEYSMMLWHTFAAVPYVYCQDEGLDNYSYWSKCGGPGVVTWYNNDRQFNPDAYVNVSCFGCYCFEYVEVNGDCESRDTIEVCFYEHPYLQGEDLSDSTCTDLCYDLGLLGIEPYEYLPGCHVNYNVQYWEMTAGVGTPVFDTINSPTAEVCVDEFGCYTFQFVQYNGDELCADTVQADLWFFEQPIADAGADTAICGNCYMTSALPYGYVVNDCHPADDATHYWAFYSYIEPDEFCGIGNYYEPCFTISDTNDPAAEICICDEEIYGYGVHYGTYGFIWTEINGTCSDSDTLWITFNKEPDPIPINGCVYETECGPYGGGFGGPDRELDGCGCATCWYPEDNDVLTVCAYNCGYFDLFDYMAFDQATGVYAPYSECLDAFAIPGYTYEWSFTGPAGSYFEADPLWYDCSCDEWKGDLGVNICFGECCDTARLYLTITTPEGCETTEEWKFYVQHNPDATITGPEIAEVSSVFEYSIPDPANPCYLYIWSVQHCGEIVYGQGTGTIGVHWTDYNVNGGWGLIYVEVYDTCTCCCSTDSLLVRVLPQYSLGEGTLEGHVYYDNNTMTPLNGVKLTLWNAGVPIFETYSFNDIEGGNGVGYYAFEGINETTEFDLTAEYLAPWYGANATDALAIELQVATMGGYTWDDVQWEAGDVNASSTLSATDALWVKQRAISMVTHFPAGDWAFDTLSSMAGTYDVLTLNYGDVNRSNIPSSNKDLPAITIVKDGTINVVQGEVFDLPIRVADAVSLGAITLNLGYNSNLLEVVEVIGVEGTLSNVSSTNIVMAWSDVNAMVLNNNDAIVVLRLKALGEITNNDQLFTIELGTEFADPSAIVLEDVTLKAFGISTEPAVEDYFLSYNRPNPFSTSTQIEYALPENGKVKLSVVDLLGQEIAVLINQSQSAGSYTVQFNAAGMAPGVYIYKITVQGDTRDFVETRRMVISH